MSINDNDAMERRSDSEVERLRARVAELEGETKLREAQTQRMMLARDAMQRERDEAREAYERRDRCAFAEKERADRAEAQVATMREALKQARPFIFARHIHDALDAALAATEPKGGTT